MGIQPKTDRAVACAASWYIARHSCEVHDAKLSNKPVVSPLDWKRHIAVQHSAV